MKNKYFSMNLKLSQVIISVVLISATAYSKTLPDYINKCSIKNPEKFSECALESAKKALPFILNGDDSYHIKKLNPFFIPFLELSAGTSLRITFIESNVTGVPTADLRSITYDKDTKRMTWDILFDFLKIEGGYTVDGKVSILPIQGAGTGSTYFAKPHLVFSFSMNEIKSKHGKQVIKVENPKLDIDFGGVVFKMENLFNGDKTLSDEMHKFLNDNWKEIIGEFQDLVKSPMAKVLAEIAGGVLNNLSSEAVFDNM